MFFRPPTTFVNISSSFCIIKFNRTEKFVLSQIFYSSHYVTVSMVKNSCSILRLGKISFGLITKAVEILSKKQNKKNKKQKQKKTKNGADPSNCRNVIDIYTYIFVVFNKIYRFFFIFWREKNVNSPKIFTAWSNSVKIFSFYHAVLIVQYISLGVNFFIIILSPDFFSLSNISSIFKFFFLPEVGSQFFFFLIWQFFFFWKIFFQFLRVYWKKNCVIGIFWTLC